MNKAEFINFISESKNITKVEAESAVNIVIDSIFDALKNGLGISLVGFGSWNVVDRAARDGYNPKTGKKMKIEAYKQPVFKAGQKLKDSCNNKTK